MNSFLLKAIAFATATTLAATGCKANVLVPADAGAVSAIKAQHRSAETGLALIEKSRLIIPATGLNGIPIAELSGLAWDKDERLLYAVSDQGYLFHFRLQRSDDGIAAVEPVHASALTSPSGTGQLARRFNAEGLTLQNADNGRVGDTTLVVSLEGGGRPSIIRFDPRGSMKEELAVPSPANDPANYRKKRQGLESVTYHPDFGMMTAPESPLLSQPESRHAIYANGQVWSFNRHAPDSRLKAADWLKNGRLLVLERSEIGAGKAMTASLRSIDLANCRDGKLCNAATLTVLPAGTNNFEGMTLLGDEGILIVSDHDGNKDPQSTTLVFLVRR